MAGRNGVMRGNDGVPVCGAGSGNEGVMVKGGDAGVGTAGGMNVYQLRG